MNNKLFCLLGLAAACTCNAAFAQELNWNNVDWSYGATSQTYYNVDDTGIDITISLSLSYDSAYYRSGNRSYRTTSSFLSGGPDDTTDFGGDGSSQNGESLYLGVNFATDDRTRSYLDVQISFSQSVNNVSFSLFDVDTYGYNYYGGYQSGVQFVDVVEQINSEYQGSTGASATVGYNDAKMNLEDFGDGPAYVGDTIRNSSSDQEDNPASVLNIGWNAPVDSVSFRYTTGSDPVRDPGQQAIGLSTISFHQYNAVPEPGTYMVGLLGCGGILFSIYRRRKKSK